MPVGVTTFLMFEGRAEAALSLYTQAFPDAVVANVLRHGADAGERAGTVQRASLTVCGHTLELFDSPVPHAFTFTPSISLFVRCASEGELDRLFDLLSADGGVLMPPGNYGFSPKFAWVSDRFGVSRQLNLEG